MDSLLEEIYRSKKPDTPAEFTPHPLTDSRNTCIRKIEVLAAFSNPDTAEIEQKYAARLGAAAIFLRRSVPQEAIAKGQIPDRKPKL